MRAEEHQFFTYNNRLIFADDTPRKLKIKNNDFIYLTYYNSLPIVWSDKNGDTRLKIEYDEPLRKLIESRCTKPLSQYRLKYNSREVSATDTPRSLRMQPDDWVYVLAPEGYNSHAFDSNSNFWIHDMNGTKIEIKSYSFSTVGQVMKRYTARTGIPASQCRFLYKFRDLNPEEKLEDLKMKRGDVIGVIYKDVDGPGCPVEKDITFWVADEAGDKRQLTMKSNATIREVLKTYSTMRGICVTDYRLDFKNLRSATAILKEIGLKDGDVINAVRELRICELCHPGQTDDTRLAIWINDLTGRRTRVRVNYDTPLPQIMRAYISHVYPSDSTSPDEYRVIYRGCRRDNLDPTITPRTMKMKNNDSLEFFFSQRGD